MNHQTTPLVLATLVVVYSVFSERVDRLFIAPALIFLLIGMALGPFGLHLLDAGPGTEGFTALAQLALTVILFNQAAKLSPSRVRVHGRVTARLLLVGIPLTIVLGTLTATLLLPVLPWWEAVCLAAIVAPTEVALIEALLDDRRIPERVRHCLSVESGFYDGFALAVLLAAMGFASQRTDPHDYDWIQFVLATELVSVAAGGLVGAFGGWLVTWSRGRSWMSDTWAQLATLALAFICFALGERIEGSGFVAAFAGGLMFALVSRRRSRDPLSTQVSDATAQLLELTVFAMFGAFAVIDAWRRADWRVVLFAAVAVFAVRLAAVLIALVRTDLPMPSRLFIGWFGPRGIGTLVLGLLVIDRGALQSAAEITTVVVVVVTLSLVVHSLTAAPGIRVLATANAPARPA